jgi:signal transduction histidine kinase
LQHLVQDLRTLSLADAGELTLNYQPVEIAPLLTRVAAVYQHQAEQQGIKLQIQPQANLPQITADAERLAQVFGNLVSNALRYTPAGGQIVLTARREANGVSLQVQDSGSGIPAADLPFIFQRFYRADKARQQQEGESGLGLAIAKAIVEAHAGSIEVASRPGAGTTFLISLPLALGT